MASELCFDLTTDAEYIRRMPEFVGNPDYSANLMIQAAKRIDRLEGILLKALEYRDVDYVPNVLFDRIEKALEGDE